MKIFFFSILLTAFCFIQTGFSCTLSGKSIEKFDDAEYIFIGEVVNYTKPVESKELIQPAHGLIIKLKESLFLPKTPKDFFEVFPIGLLSDCSYSGKTLESLKKDFPIGSEVRVIAKESKYLANNLNEGNIRLEKSPDEIGSIALNVDENGKRMTNADSYFDYKSFKYDMDEDSDSKYLLPDFEIRKDLFRLKNSRNQNERDSILQRFLDVPRCCNNLDFYTVFKTYTANEKQFELLNEARLKGELSVEEFKQYKIIDEVKKELKNLGYSDDDIEKAVGTVISDGTEISKEILIKKSLKILTKSKK